MVRIGEVWFLTTAPYTSQWGRRLKTHYTLQRPPGGVTSKELLHSRRLSATTHQKYFYISVALQGGARKSRGTHPLRCRLPETPNTTNAKIFLRVAWLAAPPKTTTSLTTRTSTHRRHPKMAATEWEPHIAVAPMGGRNPAHTTIFVP